MKTKQVNYNWDYEYHLPPGSADGVYRIVDVTSDNGDTIAIVDPDDIARDLKQSPSEYAKLLASAPDLLRALKVALVVISLHIPENDDCCKARVVQIKAAIESAGEYA